MKLKIIFLVLKTPFVVFRAPKLEFQAPKLLLSALRNSPLEHSCQNLDLKDIFPGFSDFCNGLLVWISGNEIQTQSLVCRQIFKKCV